MTASSSLSRQATAASDSESLDQFLAAVERRAWRMAWLSTGNRDEALDLVQDAMMAFVRRYRDRPAAERRPLFFRILGNRLRDWGRREMVRRRWMLPWLRQPGDNDDATDWEPGDHSAGPERELDGQTFLEAANNALRALPARQREAFLLREWEGLDVAQTASAMGVSRGSVKTHYFRAVHTLRAALEEHR
ncbi:MAG: RNA polymerase sigma factor [Wenzhouxiangellaceae bacterium]